MHAVIITPLGAFTTKENQHAVLDGMIEHWSAAASDAREGEGDFADIDVEEAGGTRLIIPCDVLRHSVIRIVGEEEK